MAGKAQLSLEDILAGVNPGGQQKIASENSRDYSPEDVQRAEVMAQLDKVASEFSETEIMKVAASAKLTGEIMTEIIVGNIKQAMPAILAEALRKIAVGSSDSISGDLKESEHNVTDANEMQLGEDRVGKSDTPAPNVESKLHANVTEGAAASGSVNPESHQGTPLSNQQGATVSKMSSARSLQLQRIIKQAMGEGDMGMGGGGEEAGPEEMLQMLMQKQQSGQPLSPEETQLLQALMAQGGGGGMGGGMVRQASANDPQQRQAAIRQLFTSFGV